MVIFLYCRWATAYSRKMRKISNLLSLYLYEFSSCMNKTAQNCRQLLNGGMMRSQSQSISSFRLPVSIFDFRSFQFDEFFRLPVSIFDFRPFQFDEFFLLLLQFNIQCWMGLHLVLFFFQVCLFVCLDAGPTSKLATNFRFRPSMILVVSEIIEFKICLGMG